MRHKGDLFNGQGWIVVSVNYRLSHPDRGAAKDPDHYMDVAAAVAWVYENIDEYGGDPGRIALLGHSAGADIVANVGVNPLYLNAHGLDLSVLRCIAPLDTEGFNKVAAGVGSPGGEQPQWKNALGNNPEYLTETSATLLVRPSMGIPPVLVVVRGPPRRQAIAIEFIEALANAGVPVTRVDAHSLTHNEVNSRIGEPGDTVITPPLVGFLKRWFGELGDPPGR